MKSNNLCSWWKRKRFPRFGPGCCVYVVLRVCVRTLMYASTTTSLYTMMSKPLYYQGQIYPLYLRLVYQISMEFSFLVWCVRTEEEKQHIPILTTSPNPNKEMGKHIVNLIIDNIFLCLFINECYQWNSINNIRLSEVFIIQILRIRNEWQILFEGHF